MNVLITGCHGFVGSNLINALKASHTIYGLDIVSPEKIGVEKTFSWKDLEAGALPEVDVIIHLAGKAHDTKKVAKAGVYYEINTGLTKK
ncbi:MAG: NAD-dependent epimerase/dehydratase family protein, partial [Bacteroidia bacterium]|nr:NAD-dependent epimerase/dehydratase family protein [Bacteroidia bacterium]